MTQISTTYSSNPTTGAGRITARVTTGEHKGKRQTVTYDHGARDPHLNAARALANRLGLGEPTYVGTTSRGGIYRTEEVTA
jgi:hypothetical protein